MRKKKKMGLVPELRFPEFRSAGEWEKKPFSKLFEIGSGRDYKHLSIGDVPVYGSGGYMLSVNDYLYYGESSCIGRKGTINNPIFLTGKFWTVDTLFYTHSFKNCLPKFVYLLFQNINWLKYNEAGGIPSLSKIIIKKIEAGVPKLDEQRKIAACLSSIDELITAQTQKLESLKAHKKGLMQQLFPAEGETVPKLRFPEFRDAGEWEGTQLGNISNFYSGGTPSKVVPEYWEGDVPWISAASMYSTDINNSELKITNKAVMDGARIVKKGVLLILVRGSMLHNRIPIGITSRDVSFNQDVKALTLKKNIYNFFLLYQLQSAESQLLNAVSATGIGAGKLDTNDLKQFLIYIPTLKEQRKIANCLSFMDDLITTQTQKLESLKAHKKGLMQKLFPSTEEAAE